jgi:hypothetical protein
MRIVRCWQLWALLPLMTFACKGGSGDSSESAETETVGDTVADSYDAPEDGEAETGGENCASLASEITQYGITWTFADQRCTGTYANGDPWVLGPVTITAISPDFDGDHHGWEVNPASSVDQGFDTRIYDYDASRVPALPYDALAGESLVKGVSLEPLDDADCRPCLQTAAVLTVVGEVPVGQGVDLFRPPYYGTDKPSFSTDELDLDLLPQLSAVADTPALADKAEDFRRVQLDHKENWVGRPLHPVDNMPDYGSSIASRNAEGALRLMLDEDPGDKMDLATTYVQYGIDIYYQWVGGVTWPPNGGHSEGRKLPPIVAAVLLGDQAMQDALAASGPGDFGENGGMYFSEPANEVLYGPETNSEDNYWTNVVFDTGSRTIRDPYELIDGGYRPGDSYQYCCLALPWKSTATAARLMPELEAVWNFDHFFTYVDRWVEVGAWAEGDTCAPPDGTCSGGDNPGAGCTSANEGSVCTGMDAFCDLTVNWDQNYGVTYGPDGNGGCIQDQDMSDGMGRFPQLHGASTDDGHYGSAFAEAMYDTHVP